MGFNFAAAKRLVRTTVHNTLAVQAFFEDHTTNAPIEIRARWHNKIDRFGDLESAGYAEVVQGIDRVVFMDLPAGVTLSRGAKVSFPDYGNTFRLELREPSTGPLQQVWQVSAV